MLPCIALSRLPLAKFEVIEMPLPWYVPLVVLAVVGAIIWITIKLLTKKRGA
jgi:hypothetical protein